MVSGLKNTKRIKIRHRIGYYALITMKIVCDKCKGTGKLFNHVDGILSLGLDYAFQTASGLKKKCWKCNGKGKIKT